MKTTVLLTTVSLATAAFAGMPPRAEGADYVLDPDRSTLVVRLSKAGIASAFAHDHVIHAADVEGTVWWDPSEPAGARVEIDVDARSLVVDHPDMRARYEVGEALDDDTRADIRETMESEKQLDVERFPRMSFASSEALPVSDGALEITGDLTLHGRTRSVTFTATPEVDSDVLRATAEIPFLQSDFGIKPYRGMLGTVRNRDEAVLIVELVATLVRGESDGPNPEDAGNPSE